MKIGLAALAILLLAACGNGRPLEQRHFYLVQPERQGSPALADPPGAVLRIGRVEVAPPFDGLAWVYRRDDVRYETDAYNEFAADPAAMLAEAAGSWLQRSGLFRAVLPAVAAGNAAYRLEARVSALYVDFQDGTPAAVLKLRWRILREDDRRSVLSLDCEERVNLAERSPEAAARAYREALRQALAKLEAELAAAGLS